MSNREGAKTNAGKALDVINALQIDQICEDNYANWIEDFKFRLDAADFIWTLDNPLQHSDKFDQIDATQLIKTISNSIISRICDDL